MIIVYIAIIILVSWTIVTYYVEQKGHFFLEESLHSDYSNSVIILFDPDPITNRDQEFCQFLKKVLAGDAWNVTLASFEAAEELKLERFDLFVFCVNEYNFGPDRITKRFIMKNRKLKGKSVSALILGKFLVREVRKEVENLISESGGILVDASVLNSIYQIYLEKEKSIARRLLEKWASEVVIFSNKSQL